MAEITLIAGSVGLGVAAFLAWYTMWHRKVESSLERVPVRAGQPVRVRREGADLEGRNR
jgi:hypothetical protein